MSEHAGSPCSCGNPNCAAGQQAGPDTVRGGGFYLMDDNASSWLSTEGLRELWERVPPPAEPTVSAAPDVGREPVRDESLIRELAAVINRGSRENRSDTPDFILAAFLSDCLVAFERGTVTRDHRYSKDKQPGESIVVQAPPAAPATPTAEESPEIAKASEVVLYLCQQVMASFGESCKQNAAALRDATAALQMLRSRTSTA